VQQENVNHGWEVPPAPLRGTMWIGSRGRNRMAS
jgi:hypothetical protein